MCEENTPSDYLPNKQYPRSNSLSAISASCDCVCVCVCVLALHEVTALEERNDALINDFTTTVSASCDYDCVCVCVCVCVCACLLCMRSRRWKKGMML